MMTNLSEGGMAVCTVTPIEYRGMIEFSFELPSKVTITGKGSVAWANSDGMLGIKFQVLRGNGEGVLQEWLQEHQSVGTEDFS